MAATIAVARDAEAIAACRALFEDYQRALGVSLCFQGFEKELAGLPGEYVPPRGGLWLATLDGRPAGCVALRPLAEDAAEMKRLFVRPDARSGGLGRALAHAAIAAARMQRYTVLKLDTLPEMGAAQALYTRLGFCDTVRYNDNPIPGARFMALDLGDASAGLGHTAQEVIAKTR